MENPPTSKQRSVFLLLSALSSTMSHQCQTFLDFLLYYRTVFKLMSDFQVKVFEACYRRYPCTVAIAGPSAEIISSIQSHESCSITSIDNASSAEPEIYSDHPGSRHKLQIFLVSTTTVTRLEKILQNLKTLQWWNHMASFLIIDSSTPRAESCSRVFQILSTAWKMNILHAKFICHHESKGPLIYSYNPYTEQAPIPWQVVKSYRRKNKHPWTLLVRRYQDGQEFCKDLDFDQTKDLGGYEIRSIVHPSIVNGNYSNIDVENLTGYNGIIAHYICRALNSTSKIILMERSKNPFGSTLSGFTDIVINVWYQQNDINCSMTYPHWRSGLASITQRRGNLSQIGKLLRVIDRASRYGAVIVGFVTFVFFKFFLRQSVTSAIMNILRLTCNTSVPNVPNNVAARIYLSGLFLFVVTMQAIYQGKFASLLTKPVALPNVETFEDLENFKYTIYGQLAIAEYFEKLNFRGRVVKQQNFDCEKYVLRDDAAACVDDRLTLINIAYKLDLHLSETIIPMFVVYIIRDDWPIEERLNAVISRLVEGNIIDRVMTNDSDMSIRKQKFHEEERKNQGFTVITLKELAFAFAILGMGLTGATVVFFIEILMGRR